MSERESQFTPSPTDVILAAIQNSLVATLTPRNLLERQDQFPAQPLSMHGLVDRDILNVTDLARVSQKLALRKH